MDTKKYSLISRGEVIPAADRDKVIDEVAKAFGLSRDKVEPLFSGKEVVLKRADDKATLAPLASKLMGAGAVVHIHKRDDVSGTDKRDDVHTMAEPDVSKVMIQSGVEHAARQAEHTEQQEQGQPQLAERPVNNPPAQANKADVALEPVQNAFYLQLAKHFILMDGERIIDEAPSCQYAGATYVTRPSGGAVTVDGVTLGSFSAKNQKREGSIFDARAAHLCVTTQRVVFLDAEISMFSAREMRIGAPFSEIRLADIRAIHKSKKLLCPAIDISVPGGKGDIDNIKVWFVGVPDDQRRNRIFDKIQKAQKECIQMSSQVPSTPKPDILQQSQFSPLDEIRKLGELKTLGFITEEEFLAKKKQLLGL